MSTQPNPIANGPVAVATPKRAVILKSAVREGTVLTFTFANDVVRKFNFVELPEELRLRCGMHGMEQKFRDNFAGVVKDAVEENTDPVILAISYTDDLIKQLFIDHAWAGTRAAGEPRETPTEILAQAIVNVAATAGATVSVEAVTKMLDGQTKEQRGALSRKADVKAQIAKIRAEKAAPAQNLDLSSLGITIA